MRSVKTVITSLFFLLCLAASAAAQQEAPRPWLGVTIQEMNEETARSMGLDDASGVLVSDVVEGGPAGEAGINMGDVILRFNGEAVAGVEDFISRVQASNPGATVALDVNKGGAVEPVSVKLGQMPAAMMGRMGQMGAEGQGVECPMGAQMGQCPKESCPRGAMGAGCPMGETCPMKDSCPMMKGGQMGQMGMGPMGGMGGMMGHGGMGQMGQGPMGMGGMMEGMKYGKMFMMAVQALELTPEQKAKVQALHSDYHKKTIRMMADIKIAELDLKDLLIQETVSLDKAKAKINDIYGKKAEMRFFRLKALEDLKKLLTPEQRKKLKEMLPMGMGGMMGTLEDSGLAIDTAWMEVMDAE